MEYDVIIIGAGPAGLTAGIYCARKMLKTLIIHKSIGGQAATAKRVENYPGFKQISGMELTSKMQKQAEKLGCNFKLANVNKIMRIKNEFQVVAEKEIIEAKSIIIATGRIHKHLEIKGEKEFTGRGVAYCATCDALFFKNKIVAVIGGGNRAFDSAYTLSKISKKVYIIHRRDEFTADKKIVNEMKKAENVEIITKATIEEIIGDKSVTGIKIKKDKKIKKIELDGIFISIGFIAPENMMKGLKTDKSGQIIVNDKLETNIKGVFAAGDITNIKFKQIITAAGQGAGAAISISDFLKDKV